ncbi:hypothetical protein PV762_17290 [Mitsuaria sp. CC2]|uniref:hypothetical protein n=1 Tax=Mitsuaria sp. CC2 TaxID=3029186 RepID=UPI003B8E462D
MKRTATSLLLLLLISTAASAGSKSSAVAELRARLDRSDVAAVNAYLSAHWESRMAPLATAVQRCDREALDLSVRLLDTTNLEALQGHTYSLELAMGKCPEKLLPLVRVDQVAMLCAVNAFSEGHPSVKIDRELDRRMTALRRHRVVAESQTGSACLDRYTELRASLDGGG